MVEQGCSGKHPNKKLAKITIDKDNNGENKVAYKTAKKEAKKSVAIVNARPTIAYMQTWIPPKDRRKY